MALVDKLMGTFHDGSEEANERMNQRLAERRWAKQEGA